MRRIHPDIQDDPHIEQAYAYPAGRPWLRVNMVASADGATWVQGRSGGLSSRGDRRIFAVLRGLSDVILVGAATVRAEGYGAVKPRESWRTLRAGRAPVPPIAVVTRSLDLDLDGPLFQGAMSRTIVVTCEAAPGERRKDAAALADVIVAGESEVDLAEAVRELHARGLTKVLCEGGPRLNAQVAAAGQLDELCLTISPMLVGGGAARVLDGGPAQAGLRLGHVLEEDGVLFCRYTKEPKEPTDD
ncbi:pyrimidine reductase family protein [Nonomuraea lactucae]|uniref:pyrimidine reductase family protein n=1 Tax=Nonomuraea lactucae TaxID=2249762 RepID=UPI000DE2BDB5|nr:pyrimidine reductase family protein [Nonomuraea lactucae]